MVDLRNSIEFDAGELKIAGALQLDAHELEARHNRIPRDRDIVLYCS